MVVDLNMNEINWFSRAEIEAKKELPLNERIVGIGIVVFCILMIIFFRTHQLHETGFFTIEFGPLEMLFFYGFWIFWITTAALEAILTQRLLSRIVDTFGGIIFATISLSILLFLFPFNFVHLTDVLPESIRFLLKWISNDIARVIMLILIILHLFAAIYSPFAYKFIDKKLFKRKKISD
jgi:fumarate reductase subunit D